MTSALPSNFTYGQITYRMLLAVADGSDSDRLPDGVPVVGARIKFTPSAKKIKDPTATPPATIWPQPIICSTDTDGYLIDPQGNRGVWLVAGDNPALNPSGFTYLVEIEVYDEATQLIGSDTFSITVEGGVTSDLTPDSPVQPADGVFYIVGPPGPQGDDGPAGPPGNPTDGLVVVDKGTVSPNIILGGARNGGAVAADVSGGVLLNPGGTGYNNVVGGNGAATVGTTTPNAASTGTGANQSVIGGYDNVAGSLSGKIIADHCYIGTETTEGHNSIYGGANHKIIGAGTGFATISGGKNHTVSADRGTIAGGDSNTVSGFAGFTAGQLNTVSGVSGYATGDNNTASGAQSWAHGSGNTAAGSFSEAHGWYANARRYGQAAYATGKVATAGDVQHSFHHVFATTTDATPTKLGVNGGTTYASNHQMLRGQTCMVQALVVGRSAGGGVQVGAVVRALVHWEATGNSAVFGTPSVELFNAPAGVAVTIVSDTGTVGNIAVRVTGVAATTIQWSAKIELAESLLA